MSRSSLRVPVTVDCPGCGEALTGELLVSVVHYRQGAPGRPLVTMVSSTPPTRREDGTTSRVIVFHECSGAEEKP